METDQKKEIVTALMGKGILIDREALTLIDSIPNPALFQTFLQENAIDPETKNFSALLEKYITLGLPAKEDENKTRANTQVIFSYKDEPTKREVKDFVDYFTSRYTILKQILQNRKELSNLTSINRVGQKREREQVSIIGMIRDKQETKTGKMVLVLEDTTGDIKAIIPNNSEVFDAAKETSMDEVIGVTGSCMGGIILANSIITPDIPTYKEIKKSPDEAYALFIGDVHIGSKVFLKEAFEKMLSWIRAEQGSEEQKNIARKLKYLFVVGDLVEGIGIYPDQDKDLDIPDIYGQYEEFARNMKKIPGHINIIICPGNHDAMRISEPQPPLYKDIAKPVWELPNVTMVSNPAYINIHSSKDFPGFDILMYHGFSFIYYADKVESIRSKGGQERVDLIMQYLLQRRHLAPAHTSTLYLPDAKKDNLVIDKVPDFFVTGHIHRVSATSYRNVTLLNCSCWLETTEYQEKLGLHPQPGRAVLVNLQTRKVKILKFFDDPKEAGNEAVQ